jgi:hypothetical protein
MLVEVLTASVPVHKLLHGACGLLLEGHVALCRECYRMHTYIPDRVIIMVGDDLGPYT